MRQQDFPEAFGRRLLPRNGQGVIVASLFDLVCCTFCRSLVCWRLETDSQPIAMNVDPFYHLSGCAASARGIGRYCDFTPEMFIKGLGYGLLSVGGGNASHRSDIRRSCLSVKAGTRYIVTIANARLCRMRRRHGITCVVK